MSLELKIRTTANPSFLEDLVRYDVSLTSKCLRKYAIDLIPVSDKRHLHVLLIEADRIGISDPFEVRR